MTISLYLNFKLYVAVMEMEMAPPPPPSAVSLSPSSYQPTLSPPLRYRRPLYPAATPPPSTAAATANANACRNSTGPVSDAGGVVLVGSYRGERGPVQMGDGFEDQIWGFDDDCNQTGQMVAGLLNWLQETFASKYDLLAGITIANLAIPQGISYAKLANLPPIIGLYSSFVPPLVYAVFGSSKHLAVGTVAACSLLSASIIQQKVSPKDNMNLYLSLFFTATFITGLFQSALGFLSTDLRLNQPRYATLPSIMKAKSKVIKKYTPEEMNVPINLTWKLFKLLRSLRENPVLLFLPWAS